MRTNIEIDDELMAKAMQLSGFSTKRETVEAALRLLVQLKSQGTFRNFRGKLAWDGDLEEMRLDRRSWRIVPSGSTISTGAPPAKRTFSTRRSAGALF